jgi:uncharacterized RmlC-like cupin family protein
LKRTEVVHSEELKKGDISKGIARKSAFEAGGFTMGGSRIPGGTASEWHHHGKREVYGYLVSGKLRLEFGRSSEGWTDLTPGDFFHIPVGLVHRDVNPTEDQDAIVVNVMVGKGPTTVNLGMEAPAWIS